MVNNESPYRTSTDVPPNRELMYHQFSMLFSPMVTGYRGSGFDGKSGNQIPSCSHDPTKRYQVQNDVCLKLADLPIIFS
jgi:hypothetical protein